MFTKIIITNIVFEEYWREGLFLIQYNNFSITKTEKWVALLRNCWAITQKMNYKKKEKNYGIYFNKWITF